MKKAGPVFLFLRTLMKNSTTSSPDLFFLELLRCFYAATAKNGSVEQSYQICGLPFRLSFSSPEYASMLSLAIEHLRVDAAQSTPFRIYLWDSASTGIFPPSPPWHHSDIREKGEVPAFSTDQIKTFYCLMPGILYLIHKERREAICWTYDAKLIPPREKAAPLSTIFIFFLSDHQKYFIHAAAVANPQGAALLIGKGGSGKSTSSLSCLYHGMEFLGDDYCALSNDSQWTVHSLYATAKVLPDSFARFPSFHTLPKQNDSKKEIIYLYPAYNSRIVLSKPVRAILIPKVGAHAHTYLQPASIAQAIKALAPSTLFQLPRTDPNTFFKLSSCLKVSPCYFLHLSPNVHEVPEVICHLLTHLR